MKSQHGQSLLELIIAIGIFGIVISSIAFLILDSYVTGRLAREITQAGFLAEEGIEAVRSIRDNSWDDLSFGSHGLAISGNNWIFQVSPEGTDISDQLRGGTRVINVVEEIDPDRKKIISQVSWEFSKIRSQQIQLVTYLTNWQKITIYCQGTCIPCSDFPDRKSCNGQDGCGWVLKDKVCAGACTPCENFLDQTSCESQLGCNWTEP